MTDGFIGLNFANDIITLLNGKWKASGGAKPLFQTQWNMNNVGLGSRNYNQVIISIDAENPQIYSMMQGDATDATKFTYDWLHDVSISIDVRTSESELRVMQLVNEHQMPGQYFIDWNASNLSTGMYFIQMVVTKGDLVIKRDIHKK